MTKAKQLVSPSAGRVVLRGGSFDNEAQNLRSANRRYFPSIGHARLCALVFRKLRDEPMRALIARLVEHGGAVYRTPLAVEVLGEPPAPGHGIPIGSCLSQWAANLYLDGLDQYVKRTLKVGAYLRYMDDFTLFADDRGKLAEARAAIAEWLARERGLTLNPKRGYIVPAAEPSTHLGYRVSRAGLSPGRKARRRMRRKLREAAERGPDAVRASLVSYQALFALG